MNCLFLNRLHKVTNSFQGQSICFYNMIPIDVQNLPFTMFKTNNKIFVGLAFQTRSQTWPAYARTRKTMAEQ